MQLSFIVKTRSTSRNEANEPYETNVSAAINTPSSYLIPTTDEPVAIGYLPKTKMKQKQLFAIFRLEFHITGQSLVVDSKSLFSTWFKNEHLTFYWWSSHFYINTIHSRDIHLILKKKQNIHDKINLLTLIAVFHYRSSFSWIYLILENYKNRLAVVHYATMVYWNSEFDWTFCFCNSSVERKRNNYLS